MRTVVAAFAHPDDEALGPGGTIALLAQTHEVHVICVTNGDANGTDDETRRQIGETRKKELLNSAEILGVKEVSFLGYHDGKLCNNLYHEIAEKIKAKVELLSPEILLTFEHRGVSGHLDHIAVSMITTYVFRQTQSVRKLMYYCTRQIHRNQMKKYFIYFPPGYEREEVDQVIDISDVWEKKVRAMYAHESQIHDVEKILGSLSQLPKEEFFFVMEQPL